MPEDFSQFDAQHVADCLTLTRRLSDDLAPATTGNEVLMAVVEQLRAANVPLIRCNLSQMTIHPLVRGYDYDWWRDTGFAQRTFDSIAEIPTEEMMRLPFYALHQWDQDMLHTRLDRESEYDFKVFDRLREIGATDYLARIVFFPGEDRESRLSRFNISFATDYADGFTPRDLDLIEQALIIMRPIMRFLMLSQVSHSLAGVYIGADAGQRVLSGEIERGSLRTVRAAILYTDMRGSTKIADKTDPREFLDFLNAYLEGAVDAIHAAGGQVLKFMGDGVMAMFAVPEDAPSGEMDAFERQVSCAAIRSALTLDTLTVKTNRERDWLGMPTTEFSTAVHMGDVIYGNIGGRDRLDFTVVGPTVNEASRLIAMARPLDRNIIVSKAVADAIDDGDRLVSMGRYMLKGVSTPRELFTVDRALRKEDWLDGYAKAPSTLVD